jgi:hypothetical protein
MTVGGRTPRQNVGGLYMASAGFTFRVEIARETTPRAGCK